MIAYCFACWAENQPESERCRRCGAPLSDAAGYDAALMAALDHPEPTTPVRAAWILGQRRTAEAVGPLRAVLRRADDPYLLEAACTTLGLIGDATAEPELIAILQRGPFLARRAAATALGKLSTPNGWAALARALREDSSTSVREAARAALGNSAGKRV